MTTTLDVPVTTASPPAGPAPHGSDLDELRDLERRVERRSDRRDGWTVMMFGIAAVALLFSMLAVGLAVRAMGDSKRQAQTAASGAAAAAVAAPPAPVSLTSVTLSDMTVTPSSTNVAPGKYTVAITNTGMMVHELLVFHTDIAAANLPVGADGKVAEDAPGFMVSDGDNLNPGASQSRVIDLTQPGTYLFVCNLPGHFTAGMHTTVTVK
ncbi:MAG: plastocyanin/azurin family copper-binding protein [Actinomycetota bacterium]|nr:plastocyanin/azurin family copper-binding protein [Actinomycetota bacterium]